MTISFVPGEPNKTQQAVSHAQWRGHSIVAYCSGNNLIILADNMKHLQTIYLDSDAVSVDINNYNGNIAVAIGSQVHIYEPMNEFMRIPRWQFLTKLIDPNDQSHVNIINWGIEEEIVVGSDYLTLWQTKKDYGIPESSILWSLKQASPVYLAKISQDSTLIASCCRYDKLLKVWNRLSHGEHSVFDLTYLSHPSSVTNIRWKRHDPKYLPKADSFTNTLYTVARDSILRIWSSCEFENSHIIQQWGSLDLFERSTNKRTGRKFVNVIDDYLVTIALKASIKRLFKEENIDIQKRQPDLATVADENGNVSIYAIENLSQNPPKMISITKLKNRRFTKSSFVKQPEFINFAESLTNEEGDVSLIFHDLNGVIKNVFVDLSFLIEDTGSDFTGKLAYKLTGHNKSIQNIIRTSDGEAILTTSRFEENAIWIPQNLTNEVTLAKKSVVITPSPISKAILLEKGEILLTICHKKLILWDASKKVASWVFETDILKEEDPTYFAAVPLTKHDASKHYVIAIYKDETKAWIITKDKILETAVDPLPISLEKIHLISPIDPVGAKYTSDRAVLSIISSEGTLKCFAGEISSADKISWIGRNELESSISNASYIRGSSISKFAIVDETKQKLTIWDLSRNVLEYEEVFNDKIFDIDWTSTHNDQSILAVGFEDYSLLYTQLRYDYTNKSPPFLAIKKIDIKNYTSHTIGDSVWLKDGILVVGSGNQLFVSDRTLDLDNDKFTKKSIGSRNIVSNDIFNFCSVLNGVLPLFHPQLIIQTLFFGKFEIVKEILLRLFLEIRSLELEARSIDELRSTLGFDTTKLYDKKHHPSLDFEEPYNKFNEQVARLLEEKLTNYSLPYLTRHQQITLLSAIQVVVEIEQKLTTLDENGLRFLLGLKLFQLHRGGTQEKLTMRDINWALHSENKELLLSIVENSIHDKKITWSAAKDYGLAYWVKYDDLLTTFEVIARNEFNRLDARDPVNCSIYYLALKKKHILIGLWRTAAGHPEQQKMLNFLKNDFKQPRWRSAALKNAFVLLSKHRYIDAAYFFLLGGSLKDATGVLIKQVGDIDLAIAVCRVYEGDNSPVLKDILTKTVLPNAVSLGDRWLTSYVFWKLRHQSRAIQALVKSPYDVTTDEERAQISLTERAKSFLEDDPLLVVLYKNLREKNLQYFLGSLNISSDVEFNFITRVASIYTRMGCDYLSVSLVKNWTFLKAQDLKKQKSFINIQNTNKIDFQDKSVLERYGLSPSARRRKSFVSDYQHDNAGILGDFMNPPEPSMRIDTKSSKTVPFNGSSNGLSTNGSNNGSTNGSSNNTNMSILEKYGLASDSKKRDEETNEIDTNQGETTIRAPPPQDAFKEPDMSAFDFGF